MPSCHQGLHQAQHIADVVGLHGTDRLVLLAIDHGADTEVREDLAEDRSLHPAIDDVGALGSFAACGEGQVEIPQVGIGVALR